tara:strand:- start:1857 stop:2066 length:210 start_codon:yes stop_codon:yes gene_type:complete
MKVTNIQEVKDWLEEEIAENKPVIDGDTTAEVGTADIIFGRNELAQSLLDLINHSEAEKRKQSYLNRKE